MPTKKFVLLTGSAYPELALKIGRILHMEVYQADKPRFADDEIRIEIPASVRDAHVFIIQPTCPPQVDRHYNEIGLIADAAIRSSATEITAVVPYLGYARQDRQNDKRQPISISYILNCLTEVGGVKRIVTLDVHSEQSFGAISKATDLLHASSCLVPAIYKKWPLPHIKLCTIDQGGTPRTEAFRSRLEALGAKVDNSIAVVIKERDKKRANQSHPLYIAGDVKGCDVIFIDDMIDTAGSLVDAARLAEKHGARSIRAVASHGLFSDTVREGQPTLTAIQKIKNSPIQQVMVTNTIKPKPEVLKHPKLITYVDIAPLLSEAIRCIKIGKQFTGHLDGNFFLNNSNQPSL